MTEIRDTKTETIELTNALLQVLLNMTGGDPDLQQPRIRSLTEALHGVPVTRPSSRWTIEVSDDDIRTIHYVLRVYHLNHPQQQTRFENHMCRQSLLYRQLVLDARREHTAEAT